MVTHLSPLIENGKTGKNGVPPRFIKANRRAFVTPTGCGNWVRMGSVLEKYLFLLGSQRGYAFTPEGIGGGSANGPKVLDAPCPALQARGEFKSPWAIRRSVVPLVPPGCGYMNKTKEPPQEVTPNMHYAMKGTT